MPRVHERRAHAAAGVERPVVRHRLAGAQRPHDVAVVVERLDLRLAPGALAVEVRRVFLLDVRDPREIAQSGAIAGAACIPMKDLESRLGEVPRDCFVVTA